MEEYQTKKRYEVRFIIKAFRKRIPQFTIRQGEMVAHD
jgi:hypothetical protein